jgi:hypothetical protein
MTAAISEAGLRANRPMAGAELRCLTESLGLSVAFLAKRWNATQADDITEGRVKNWMKGTHDLPQWVAADVWAMVEHTEDRLDAVVAALQPGNELPTYRSDREYREHLGEDAPYSASWHRMLCARAAAEIDNITLVYAVAPAYFVRRVSNG